MPTSKPLRHISAPYVHTPYQPAQTSSKKQQRNRLLENRGGVVAPSSESSSLWVYFVRLPVSRAAFSS
jgi:hypothetical protein